MPTLAIVGGKLQGTEAVYLARKAGFTTLLIDRNPNAPAAGLCHRHLTFEFGRDGMRPPEAGRPDLILPAVEDAGVLDLVRQWAATDNIPLAFDPDAYGISTSKLASDRLFRQLGLPAPAPWPGTGFPLVVKPDQASGSQGVVIVSNADEMNARFPGGQGLEGMVVQEYVAGPSYSIEVMGRPGAYAPLQVTDLGMDETCDCNAVQTPSDLPEDQARRFGQMAETIAETLGLTGVMDLEAIFHGGRLKLLEIDARLPSQTPMAVYWSTGMNMVAMLADLFLHGRPPRRRTAETPVLLEHIRVRGRKIEFSGEHIMAGDGPLGIQPGFFGADEALTSFRPGRRNWVATMIFCAETAREIQTRRRETYHRITAEQETCQ